VSKKVFPTPGQRVTCRIPVPAYYSGYGLQSVQDFRPDMAGVAEKTVPYVSMNPNRGCRCQDFVVVDFTGDNGKTRRVGLDPHNIVLVKEN
jgi:hypothetical protein